QVDRQTKSTYATFEAAEAAGMAIKKGHPLVHVGVYDHIEGVNKIIRLPEARPAGCAQRPSRRMDADPIPKGAHLCHDARIRGQEATTSSRRRAGLGRLSGWRPRHPGED